MMYAGGARGYRKPLKSFRWRDLKSLLRDILRAWSRRKAPRLGASLAFYALLSLAPLLLVIASIVGVSRPDLAFGIYFQAVLQTATYIDLSTSLAAGFDSEGKWSVISIDLRKVCQARRDLLTGSLVSRKLKLTQRPSLPFTTGPRSGFDWLASVYPSDAG